MQFPYFRYAASLIVAAGIFAGCGGGGKSLVPGGSSQQSLGQSVPVTFTVTIGSQSQTQSTKRSPQFIPSNTQSIVIDYIGDNPSATPAPGATPPANVTTAATVNVTATTTNPPPAGECFASNGTYTCTISLKLPVGILDLYVLAYAGQNGTGLLLSGAAVIVQVNANGTVTQPGSTAPISIALVQKGVQVGTASLGSNATVVPNGIPKPSVTAPSYPTNSAPYVYSAAETVAVANPSGTPIPAGTPISSITVTDNESGGASCLVYIPNGATTATPCPFATSASSVTLQTSGDSFALLYNGKFAPAGSISITGSVAGSSTVPTPITVAITPTVFSAGTVTLSGCCASVGSTVYDPINKNAYVGMANATTPLYKISYSATTGYGTPSAVNVASVNGSGSALSANRSGGGVNAMTIGPDNNIWMLEHDGGDNTQYVAVAAINSAVINPISGGTLSAGAGVFAEYEIDATAGPSRAGATPVLHGIASLGGFIWVMDKDGDLWRIDPTTGLVSPNLAAGYLPGSPETLASNVTDPTGATQISGDAQSRTLEASPLFAFGTNLYVVNAKYGSLDTLTVDTSASPSAGLCTPAGPPPCIATYVRSLSGQMTAPYYGGYTDGTNMYAVDSSTSHVYKITTGGALSTSTSSYSNTYGGLGVTADGWLWTLNNNGVEALQGMTSSAPVVDPAAVTACETNANGLKRGAFAFMIGPDGTLLFSPNNQNQTLASAAVLCAVVY